MRPLLDRSLLIVSLLLACIGAIAVFLIVSEYSELLSDLSELPLLTFVALHFYPASLAFPLIVYCAWRFWPWQRFRAAAALAVGALIAATAPVVTLFAMYLPVVGY